MAKRLVISPQARADVEALFVYIATENFDAGFRYYDAAFESFNRLVEHPFIGAVRKFRNADLANLRMWFVQGL